jgi:putative ABC transport system permease protein
MQSARIVFRNIARQKKRTVLLGGAIAFGVLIIVLIGSFTTGVSRNVQRNFTGIFGGHVYLRGEELSPSGRILARIGDPVVLSEVLGGLRKEVASLQVRSRTRGEAIFGSRREALGLEGVDWAAESDLWEDLGVVRGQRTMLARPNAVILPEAAAVALGVEIGETILFKMETIAGQANVGELTVAGVYPGNQGFNLAGAYTGLPYLNSLLGLQPHEYQLLNVTLRDLEEIDRFRGELEAALKLRAQVMPRRQEDDGDPHNMMRAMMRSAMGGVSSLAAGEQAWGGTRFSITTLNELLKPMLSLVQTLNMIRLGLFAILLLITMVGLLNSFRLVLIERTQEIGTMRALGMLRGEVRNSFLLEALFLALAGAVLGLAAAVLGMGVLGALRLPAQSMLALFTRNGRFSLPFLAADVAATLAILSGVTVLSAWLPARKAARLKPADALRATY